MNLFYTSNWLDPIVYTLFIYKQSPVHRCVERILCLFTDLPSSIECKQEKYKSFGKHFPKARAVDKIKEQLYLR